MKSKLFLLFIFLGLIGFSQPINDNPCNAVPLSITSTCNQITGTNNGATASAGVPAPGCGSYVGGDIWYSVVCPASGAFTVTTYATGLNDCAMAVYSGNCSSLALVSCSINGNGLMPKISVAGTAGTTYYFRLWDENNDVVGNVDICATATATAPLAPNNQDCLNAIPVCASSYTNPTSYSGTGNIGNEITPGTSCLYSGEKNDVWYQFTVQNAGQLCFMINPNTNTNDYDWAVFDLTSANCSDIATNGTLQVSCNYSGNTAYSATTAQHPTWAGPNQNGNTGMSPTSNSVSVSSNSQVNPCIAVNAGESYVLNISNFSSSAAGYELYFPPPGTAGMAIIYDNVPPVMQGLTASPGCGGNQVIVKFSENVQCSTASPADFSITGPGGPYTVNGIVGSACTGGSLYENQYLLNFTPAISNTGTYTLCLTNSAGSVADACNNLAAPACFTFAVAGPTITTVVSNVNCNGASTGSISASATGGTGFTYQLNTNAAQASGSFTGLAAGTYTVKAISGSGCSSATVVTISEPPALTVTAAPSAASCAGTGSISTTVSGGTPGYTYAWTPSGSGANPTGLPAGTYTVTVTDSKSCTKTAVATIGAAPTVTATFSSSANQCLNGNSFTFTNTGTAGGTHTYSFSPAAGAPATGSTANYGPVAFTAAGTYTVTHTVNNGGCIDTRTTTVIVFPNPTAVSTASTNATCGLSNGSFTVSGVTGGTPSYNYSLNGSAYSAATSTTNLPAGTYNISVRDANNCTYTTSVNITNTPGPTAITLTSNSASCGSSNGSINTPTVTGGTPTYSYSVNGGAFTTSPALTGLAAGSYSITVKDANGCTIGNSTTVGTLSGPSNVNLTSTPTSCTGSTGTYSIGTVTGGTGPYTYSVSPGPAGFNSTTSFTGLAAGTYTVIVKDNGGCTYSKTIAVGGVSGPSSMTVTTGNASCGSANGTATVTGVTGGTPTYNYQIDGGAFNTPTVFTGLTAGSHTVTVQDNNGCMISVVATVGNNGSPTANVSATSNISCNGGANGSFTVSASGGSGAFTYSVTPGGLSNGTGIFTGLTAQPYTITVKDAANCVTTTSTTLTQPSVVTETLTPQNVSCNAGSNGTITVTGSGGTGPYQYSLNGGAYQGSNSFTGLTAGVFNITIKDNNGCTLSQTTTVNQPTPLTVAITSGSANCTASNGTATAVPSGGTPGYTYSWTGGGGTTATSNGVAAGNYTVTVTDSKSCVKTGVATIGVIAGGTASISTISNVSCFGANNGSLTVSMAGNASPPFTYVWSPSGGSGATATGLAPGTYTVTVKDVYNCTSLASATIGEPAILKANLTATNVACFGGSTGTVAAAGQGGTPPYGFVWNPSASTNTSVPNVPVGTYSCTVTDAHGCVVTNTISVTQPTSVTITSTATPANCNQPNGAASITASGGTASYTYTWSTGATASSISSVAAGTYSVQVKDGAGCLSNAAVTIPNLSGPTMTLTSKVDVSCNGGTNGSATYTISGGSGPYIYHWSNNQVTPAATNLAAGLYTVSATDQNGCVASASVTITEPPLLVLNTFATNPKCFNSATGSATVSVTGGTPNYSYSWTGSASTSSVAPNLTAGNYIATVTDSKGCIKTTSVALTNPPALAVSVTNTAVTCFGACNGTATANPSNNVGAVTYNWSGSNPQTTQTASGLCASTYTVNISDQNGCTATGTTTITQPSQLTASITASGNVGCYNGNNGFATVTAAGGTPAYTYTWSGGAGNNSNANNLTAGNYSVNVTDNNGCTATTNVTITQPALFTAVATGTNVKCFNACDGKAVVNYTGGTGPYTFLWSPSLATTYTVNNLCDGPQNVTVTDANGCTASSSVTLTQPQQLTAAPTASSSNCGQANGNACVNVSGGTAPLNYLWSNGVTTSCNFNVVAGAYTITVTDANTCSVSAISNINDIAGPTVVITSTTAVKCYGGSDGTAMASISGGALPYASVLWSGGQSTPNPTNLNANLHSITVTDDAGCVASASVQITQPAQLVSAIQNPMNVTCNAQCNGSATMLANGGTTPYNFSWNSGAQTSSTAVSLCAGNYTCVVTDGNLCTSTQSVTITEPLPLTISSFSVTDVSCNGLSNGNINTNAVGGTPGYSYTWTPASAGNSANAGSLPSGAYALYVQDSKGCSVSGNYTVNEPGPFNFTTSDVAAKCGLNNGSAGIVNLSGGTQPYQYSWNSTPNQGTSTATALYAGTYTCIISDAHSCAITTSVSVPDAASPIIDSITVVQPLCYGQQTGQLEVFFHKGTPGFNFTWSTPISQTTQTVTGVGAGAYTVAVTDFYGCVATGAVVVTEPNILVLNVSPDQTICYGQSAQIYGQAQGGNVTGGYTYTWNPSTFSGAGPQTVSPTATTQYTVAVGDSKGCTASPKVITVNVKPQLTASGYSLSACDKDSVSLTPNITSPGAGAPYTYAWNTGATTGTIKVKANYASSPNNYTVTIKDGCTIPDGKATFTLTVNPIPVGTFTADVLQGCAPLAVTFTATSNTPTDTYAWNFGDGGVGSSSPITHVYSDSSRYTVQLIITNVFGCARDTQKVNYIKVFAQPVAEFSSSPNPTSILDPTVNFHNESQGAIGYYWSFGDPDSGGNNASSQLDPFHSYDHTGTYYVYLVATSSHGCKDTAIHPVEITPDFALYIPNAFTVDGNGRNDIFQPMGVGINEDNYRMDIFDRWGEIVFTSNNFRKGWDGSVKGGSKIGKQDVYVYKITVYDLEGEKHTYVGHVTLLKMN